jgi:hypothetical protein
VRRFFIEWDFTLFLPKKEAGSILALKCNASARTAYPAEAFAKGGDGEEHLFLDVFVSTAIILDCSEIHKV